MSHELHPNNMIEPFWYFHQMRHQMSWIHDKINSKALFAEYAAKHWNDECLVEKSGMDCDGMQYAGNIMSCPINFYSYDKMIEDEYSWADGPMYFRFITLKEAAAMKYRSVDRAMEAYEDGHPSTLYMGSI